MLRALRVHAVAMAVAVLATTTVAAAAVPAPPQQPWMDPAEPPAVRTAKLLAAMQTDEKTALMHGSRISRDRECGECPYGPGDPFGPAPTKPKNYKNCFTGNTCGNTRLMIPTIRANDGPQGLRGGKSMPDKHSTAWPAAISVAASFDPARAKLWGEMMGSEFYGLGANVQLGPGLCLARIPTGGRNFEYLSGEDPYLGAQMSAPAVVGIQSQGVIANAKHFVDNNQETERFDVTEVVDERTQWEMYYPPFQAAVDAGLLSVMCSYNKVQLAGEQTRGIYSCENPLTLQRDLKERMNFSGFVASDYGGTHSQSVAAGLDQEMPGAAFLNASGINASLASGALTMKQLDDSAGRILTALFAVGAFDKPNHNTPDNNVATAEHHAIAAELSAAGTVLLKNDGPMLPLQLPRDGSLSDESKQVTIAVIGHEASSPTVVGGGSGHVTPANLSSPLAAIRHRAGVVGNASCNAAGTVCVVFQDVTSARDVAAAVTLAQSATYTLVFVATSSEEGIDRYNLTLTNPCQSTDSGACTNPLAAVDQDELVHAVVGAAGARTAVVAVCPGALLTPWADKAAAVLIAFLPGQAYGEAIASILFGDFSPSARLPVTFPTPDGQQTFPPAAYPGLTNGSAALPIPVSCNFKCPLNGSAVYEEKLLVGYRWFDAHNISPAFCFGHGLSFSTFSYSGLAVTPSDECQQDGREWLAAGTTMGSGLAAMIARVSFKLTNSGKVAATDVPQLYLTFPTAAGEPPKQLKGFAPRTLAAGASISVAFNLTARDVSTWDVATHGWLVQKGAFGVSVGASSCDLRLNGSFTIH